MIHPRLSTFETEDEPKATRLFSPIMNDFCQRDTTVIPWLPQYSRPSISSVAAAAPKRPCKIISLLSARERIGLKSYCTKVGSLREGVLVSNEELSAAGAWNRRRMQNMILAVGPGTPASCVLTSIPTGGDTSGNGNDSESNDEDDIYHADSDDDVEMLESDGEDGELGEEEAGDVDDGLEQGDMSESSGELEIVHQGTTQQEDTSAESKRETNSDEDRLDAEAEIARHLAARPIEEEKGDQAQDNTQQGTRSSWTHRQERIRNALNGEDSDPESAHDSNALHSQSDSSDNDNSSNESDVNESRSRRADQVLEFIEQQIMRQHRRHHRSQVSTLASPRNNLQQNEREVARSIKHSGCINTACWLQCGWRISTMSHEDAHPYDRFFSEVLFTSSSHSSNENYSTPARQNRSFDNGLAVFTSQNECPTQIITSGDDHVVKFWDLSLSMGSTTPLPGGSATINPFSSPMVAMKPTSELITKWRNHMYPDDELNCSKRYLPGIVHPLLTLSTGHRGNVFHATPIPNAPGKVLTCAADGFLRLTDVEINATSSPAARSRGRSNSTSSASNAGEASAIIISPEFQSENGEAGRFRFRDSLMCFSHHFLNSNVGLVCSERGLLHFDLRLSPSSQKRGSLVEELSSTCKSCCVWKEYDEDSDSAFVFAGGSGTDVGLYDLRMTGRTSSQAVQRYRPRPLRRKSSVSISGIEVSKDKRELLVAYESDQCYTFPVFPNASVAGPAISEIDESTEDLKNGAKPVSELCQYGGHLNRLTFLKMAKYAGPNDEYICTGSDSGHAWIYDKQSGSVAAFLRADHSTCNGILPHPSLPYFITYGIDSTVKLWRATIPVDNEFVDDSNTGRFAYSQREDYKKSIVVDKWKAARKRNPVDLDNEDMSYFPNETPIQDVVEDSISLGFMGLLFSRTRTASDPPFIGNDLANLSNELKKNYYTCARSGMGEDTAVKSGLTGLKRRMSLMTLRHHADRLGLNWDGNVPWNFSFIHHLLQDKTVKVEDPVSYGALVDLIPDPSDWIPFNALLANPPLDCGMQFSKRHKQFYSESYTDKSLHPIHRFSLICDEKNNQYRDASGGGVEDRDYDAGRAWDILHATITLLKEAGNAALQKSLNRLAARYYDKAILYCSLAYMEFPVGNCDFLAQHQIALSENSGLECRWTTMLKTFIQVRLNMSLCCLKSDVNDTKAAMFLAKLALKELKPFLSAKGCVKTGKKLERSRLEEPEITYTEAMALQSKAYFRLGSAQLLLNDFEDAIESFEQSIKSSSISFPEKKPDAAVLRKLQEAKLANRRQCNSERKKFKFAFATKEQEQQQTGPDEAESELNT